MKIWTTVKCMGSFKLKLNFLVLNNFFSVDLFRIFLLHVNCCKFFLHSTSSFLCCKRIAWGVCVSWSKELYFSCYPCVCIQIFFSFRGYKNSSFILKVLGKLVGTWCVNLLHCCWRAMFPDSQWFFFFGSSKRYLLCSTLYAFQGLWKCKTRCRNSSLRNISLASYNFIFLPPV